MQTNVRQTPALITIPANIEAEEAVIGSLLMEPGCANDLLPIITAGDFYREKNGWIYQAILDLCEQRAVDMVNLTSELEKRGQLKECGGPGYIVGLINETVTAIHAVHYARLVRDTAQRRRLIASAQELASLAYDPEMKVDEILQRGMHGLEAVMRPDDDGSLLTWEDKFPAWAEWQTERANHRNDAKLDMPWSALNFVRPLRGGTLAVVAADSGAGKTVFMEQCAEYWAKKGFRVAFFHLELSHQIMLDRQMVRHSGESMETIEAGDISPRMLEADEAMTTWRGRINYIFCPDWTVHRIIAKARNLLRRHMCDVIVLDYFQKIKLQEHVRGLNAAQMRGQDAEALKNFCENEGIPLLTGSQLNREEQKSGRKTKAGIRDTGELAEKANLVITLDRPILSEKTEFDGTWIPEGDYSPNCTVRVDKQTLGRTGEAHLMMSRARYFFAGVSK